MQGREEGRGQGGGLLGSSAVPGPGQVLLNRVLLPLPHLPAVQMLAQRFREVKEQTLSHSQQEALLGPRAQALWPSPEPEPQDSCPPSHSPQPCLWLVLHTSSGGPVRPGSPQ